MTHLQVFARGADLRRSGEVTDLDRLETISRHNGVGTWVLELDRASAAAELMLGGQGIVVVRDGHTLLSGPRTFRQVKLEAGRTKLTLAGVDDTVWLDRRLALPPAGLAYDTRRGPAEDVLRGYVDANLGPGAAVARRLAGLTLPASQGRGANVVVNGRYQSLLELAQVIGLAGGISFRLVQVDLGLQLEVTLPADRTRDAVFSTGLGNLAGVDYSETDPTATYAYVGGQGEGAARTIVEGGAPPISELALPVFDGYTFSPAAWTQDGWFSPPRAYTNTGTADARVLVDLAHAGTYEVLYDAERDPNRCEVDVLVDGQVLRRLPVTDTQPPGGVGQDRAQVLAGRTHLDAGQHQLQVRRVDDGSGRFVSFHGLVLREVTYRAETFRDQRDTDELEALAQSRDEALTEGAGTTALALSPIDTDSVAYGREYALGDMVTVLVDGEQLQDVVREVKLTYDNSDGEKLTPVVGTPGARDPEVPRLFDALHRLALRQSRLERR